MGFDNFKIKYGISLFIFSLLGVSCIESDRNVGRNFLNIDQQYDIYHTTLKISDIEMEYPEELSGYDNRKFAVGAIRDESFGLTTRSAAFSLVPCNNKLDFGKPGTQKFKKFRFVGILDKVSFKDEGQKNIIQNINVYELNEPVDTKENYPAIKYGTKRITDGIPVYSGADFLSFDFSADFGKKFLNIAAADLDSIGSYVKKFPGIYICSDEPVGNGGRINIFKLPLDISNSYITGSHAELHFSAEYDNRGTIDTVFYFALGATKIEDLTKSGSTNEYTYPQVTLQQSSHEVAKKNEVEVRKEFYLEGGRGMKPVIKIASLRKKLLEEISRHGDPQKAVVFKATINLPYKRDNDYESLKFFPDAISPICKTNNGKRTTFIGITDSSNDKENPGKINRSLDTYSPDVSFHIQDLLSVKDESKLDNYNIWLFSLSKETVSIQKRQQDEEREELLRQMYLRNLEYNDFGLGYNNNNSFSNMWLYYQALQNNSEDTVKEKLLLDGDSYYKVTFKGTDDKDSPTLVVTYAVPKKKQSK